MMQVVSTEVAMNNQERGSHPTTRVALALLVAACVGVGLARTAVAMESLLLWWIGMPLVPLIAAGIARWSGATVPWALAATAVASAAFLIASGSDSSEMGTGWRAFGAALLLLPMIALGVTGVLVAYALGRSREASG